MVAGIQDWFGSDDEFVGHNPSDAATIDYWLKKRHLFGDLKIEVYDTLGDLTFLVDRFTGLKDQAEERAESLSKKDQEALEEFADTLDALHQTLVVTEGGWISGREELRERLGTLYGDISFYDGRPTDSQLERMATLRAELDAKETEFEAITRKVDSVNRILAKRDLEPLTSLTREEWDEQQEGAGGSTSLAMAVSRTLLLGF